MKLQGFQFQHQGGYFWLGTAQNGHIIYFNVIFLATPTFDSSSCCGRVRPRTHHIFVIVSCIYVAVHAFFIIDDGFLSK